MPAYLSVLQTSDRKTEKEHQKNKCVQMRSLKFAVLCPIIGD